MGSVNIDNTGSGADVTLSSDGTDLLLDGTAIGGGGGSPDLLAENYDGTSTKPTATGTNAVAIGELSTASPDRGMAFGYSATASGTQSTAVGRGASAGGTLASAFEQVQAHHGKRPHENGEHKNREVLQNQVERVHGFKGRAVCKMVDS